MDIFIQKLHNIVNEIESRHPNDPEKIVLLNRMTELMLEDEKRTIDFLENCNTNHARIIYWLSPWFDDIACQFYSDKVADAMISLIDKYPEDIMLQSDVQIAIDVIRNIQKDNSLQ
ncbi:hypothetical protein [Chamaesiphon minutus]|uniref:Immunity protein 30 domain-containing protein n=1 Tax=Chamaesiphon minutus (strain ATCC 27169 / PCC 6605) TaxID=1173020 RepID=K9UPR2_CHAP6|nr:hypothetical protein [Chamaesiphon minutus]AFY96194.1 hypothetical protein Cha6605_5307 [Chamaesiphon minutus PCC 6605]